MAEPLSEDELRELETATLDDLEGPLEVSAMTCRKAAAELRRLRAFEARIRLILGTDMPRDIDGWDMNDTLQSYELHLKQSVLDEREACARIADENDGYIDPALRIAALIRARTS